MKLDFLPLAKLCVSRANMRAGRKAAPIDDILPSIRARGVLVPVLVRPVAGADPEGDLPTFEVVAGSRRFRAAQAVAAERTEADGAAPEPLPCAILEEADDASAVEASLIENVARADADEVTLWESFTRLVREGREVEQIAATFGMEDRQVRRILALGNLLPRIRSLYAKEEIDAASIRHLTLASRARQKEWLALFDDETVRAPTGQALKSWLFGGSAIPTSAALFDLERYDGRIVADLFGEGGYFADADAFWTAQHAAVEAKREAYLAQGWGEVVIVPPDESFHYWEHERAAKRKGGRVYIVLSPRGEVAIHEGYVTRKEARAIARGTDGAQAQEKPKRPELSSALQTYVDLHRHACVRAAMLDHGGLALRMMVAHAILGSPLWSVRPEPQTARHEAVRESVETSPAELRFDQARRRVLGLLDADPERLSVTGGNGDGYGLVRLLLRLLDLSDAELLEVVAVVMGETLSAGSAAVEAVAAHIAPDMAALWQPDAALFALLRDKELLGAMVAEVAGEAVAAANAKEKGSVLKAIIRDHLDGANGRAKLEGWVPRWLRASPSAYTPRGGVNAVRQRVIVDAAREEHEAARAGGEEDGEGGKGAEGRAAPSLAAAPEPDALAA